MLAKFSFALALCAGYVFALEVRVPPIGVVGRPVYVDFIRDEPHDPSHVALLLEDLHSHKVYTVDDDISTFEPAEPTIPRQYVPKDPTPFQFIATHVKDHSKEYARSNTILVHFH